MADQPPREPDGHHQILSVARCSWTILLFGWSFGLIRSLTSWCSRGFRLSGYFGLDCCIGGSYFGLDCCIGGSYFGLDCCIGGSYFGLDCCIGGTYCLGLNCCIGGSYFGLDCCIGGTYCLGLNCYLCSGCSGVLAFCGCDLGPLCRRSIFGRRSIFAVLAVVLGPCCLGLGGRFTLHPVAARVDLEVLAILSCQLATFGGLLDRQADSAAGKVEIDDLDPQLFAGCDYLFWGVDVVR
jgi:hypothetical protein